MSYHPNPNRHIYTPSSSHTRVSIRPNLSWSTIREESSSDFLTSELDEKRERISRLKKLERLKERRYMDYQSLKRRGSSKEYSDRFQRDCEEFNKLKYRQVHHTSLHTFPSKHRSVSVSDITNRRHHFLHSSRYGHTYLRGNQDDGHTLSPTGSISSIVTLDDDYMYGSRYSSEDNWASWRPRSRTSSFSTSMARDRLGHYGLSSHEMLDDNPFDDASSEYSFSGYVPQRRAFSSCVTPRRYTGIMTPTGQNADAMATVERMNQLSERLKLLQTERLQGERRRSVDHTSSLVRSHLPTDDHTETATASIQGRFSQNSQTNILPQSPTDHSIPAWSQRVNLLLSSHHQEVPYLSSDTEYSSSHVEPGSSYTTDTVSRNSSEILDSTHSAEVASIRSFHSMDLSEPRDSNCSTPNLKKDTLSRSFIYQRPESFSTSTSEMRQERVSVHSPSHLSMTAIDTHHGPIPIDTSHGYQDSKQFQTSHGYQDGQQFQTSHTNIQHIIRDTNQNINLQQPGNISSKTEYSTHVLKDGQYRSIGADPNGNFQRTTEVSHYLSDMSPSPLSPESQNKNFVTHERKSIIIQHGLQGSQLTGQDDISDSGVESASDAGRVSSSVSSDSISKFLVSASKPSESRGMSKFEISLESSGQRAGSSELSPEDAAYHSIQEVPQERSSRDSQDSTSTTIRKYGDSTHSLEFRCPQDNKIQSQTIVTEQANTQSGQHDSVQADKSISGAANTITRKERMVEDPASTKLATMNVEMKVSQPKISDTSRGQENQALGINQQHSTKTMIVPQTRGSVQKKQVSSEVQHAERKPSTTATLKMVTQRSEEFAEDPSAQLELQNQPRSIQFGQKQPEEYVYNSSDSVIKRTYDVDSRDSGTLDIKRTYDVDSRDSLSKTTTDMQKDNSSIFQPDETDSETRRMENVTATTIVKTVDNYSTETKEQVSGINEQYNQDNVQTLKSPDPMKDTMPQVAFTTNKVSETMPLVRKIERIEIHSKRPDDKNTNNVSKTLSSNQEGTSQIVFKTVSDKHESADVFVLKSVEEPSPNVTEAVQEYGSSGVMESIVSEEQEVSDLNVITPKKKKSKKKKSLKGGEKNGLDSSSKTEEQPISTMETSGNLELSSSYVDGEKIQPKVSISSQQVTQKEADKVPKRAKSQEKSFSTTTHKSSTEMATTKEESLPDIYQNGTKVNLGGTVMISGVDLPPKSNMADKKPTKQPEKDRVQSPAKISTTKPFKSSNDVTIPKEDFQTDGTTNVTIVKTEQMMDATRKTVEQLQSGDEKPSVDVVEERTPSPISSKLTTTSYQMASSIDNVYIHEPGRRSKEKLSGATEGMHRRAEEQHLRLKTAEPTYLIQDSPVEASSQEIEETAVNGTSKEKSKKKKNSSKMPSKGKGKEDEQSETFSKESAQIKTTKTFEVSPRIHDRPEEYNFHSVSAIFPGQEKDAKLTKSKEQSDLPEKVITTSTTKTITSKISEIPEKYNIRSVFAEFPGQDPQQTDFTQGNIVDKTSPTIKMAAYKMVPGMPDKSEEYKMKSLSAEFPGQQIELGKDGEMVTKVTTTTKTTSYEVDPGMLSGPEAYNVQSVTGKFPGKAEHPKLAGSQEQGDMFGKVTTATKTIAYKTSEWPEEYNNQNISAELPGQVKAPQRMEFTQGNMVDKVVPITKTTGYKMVPEMSERPEEYHVQSISAEFPGQIKSPTQTDFTQGNIVDKASPTIKMAAYKMVPGMSDKSEDYKMKSLSAEFPGQQTELRKDGEIITKLTTTSYEVESGLGSGRELTSKDSHETEFKDQYNNSDKLTLTTKPITMKMSERPEELNIPSVSMELPENSADPHETEAAKSSFFGRFASTLKSTFSKVSPGTPDKSEFTIPSISDNSADSSVDPVPNTRDQASDTTKASSVVEGGLASPSVKAVTQTTIKNVTTKPSDLDQVTSKNKIAEPKSMKPEKRESFKDSVVTESMEQSGIVGKGTTVTKTPTYKMSEQPEENKVQQPFSATLSDQVEMPQAAEQRDISRKPVTTTTTKSTTFKAPKDQEDYNVQSVSAKFPGQVKGPQQSEFTQGNMIDKVATTINTVAYKTSEKPEDYKTEPVSVKFPGQKAEFEKDGEMVRKVTTTTKTTSYEVEPELLSGPEGYNFQSVMAESARKFKSSQQREPTQGKMADKVTSTVKSTASKVIPDMSNTTGEDKEPSLSMGLMTTTTTKTATYKRPETQEDYNVQSISAEFPGQVKGPQQTEFTQGNMTDKVATTINTMAYKTSEKPGEYNTKSISVKFPGQKAEFENDGEMVRKVTTTTKTTSYEVDPGMLSGPEAYNVQSVTRKFPGKGEHPKLAGSQEQGDMFGKVTTATKTIAYKTSEWPEEYNLQNISAELPGQVKAPQRMEFTQGNIVDKVVPITKTAGYKMVPGMFERPEEYHIQSISTEFPGQIKSPMQADFTQGNIIDKVATTTVSTGHKMVPEMSDMTEKLKMSSMSVKFPDQISISQQPGIKDQGSMSSKVVTTTETISDKIAPEISKNQEQYKVSSTSELPKETQFIQQDVVFGKMVTTSKDVAYKTDKAISEKPEELKAQQVSVEFPGMPAELEKAETTANTIEEDIPAELPKQKSKPHGKAAATTKKGTKKMSERPEEFYAESVPAETAQQPKDKPKKEKPGFLDKVATTFKSTFSKKSPGASTKSEEFPELVKESSTVDQNAPNVPYDSHKASYKSVVESGTVSPTIKTTPQRTTKDLINNKQGISLGKDNLDGKVTATTKTTDYKVITEITDLNNVQSILPEYPGQLKGPQQTDTEGVKVKEDVKVVKTTTNIPEEYTFQSISAEIPVQEKDAKLIKSKEQSDLPEKVITTSTTKTTISKISETPEKYNIRSVSAEFPGQGPQQTDFTQGNIVDKVAPTIKMAGYKMVPGMSDESEEYKMKSLSAEFPGQQIELGKDGEMVTKVTTTTKTTSYEVDPGMLSGPEAYNVQSVTGKFPGKAEHPKLAGSQEQGDMFGKVTTATKTIAYKTSEWPEEYNIQNISAELPGQVKAPQWMEFTQGNIADKVVPVTRTAGYKMVPGMSERPEEYHVQSISAEFPGQIKSPMQTDFTQGNIADKVATTTVSTGHKMVPEMSDMSGALKAPSMFAEFPGLVEGPKHDQPSSKMGTPDMQTHTSHVSYKTVLERGIKPLECILPPATQRTDISINTKNSQPNVSYTLSGDQPDLKTASLETSHFTLEKPVTTVKTTTKTVSTDLTDSSVDLSTDFSVKSGTAQEPASTLSQDDPRCVVPSIFTELPEHLKSSETDAYSTDFSVTSTEQAPMTRQKSWSDVVKKGKTVDISGERSQLNISPSISIDKVERPGGRSPQQTENEGRTMSGGSQAFVISASKGTSLLEHADISSRDVVAPLKGKPMPSSKPLLRKLSGQDFSVSDVQKTAKPTLKLVAPDCTLLQTKFETDGWKPKVKSPTATRTAATTIVQSELISCHDLEHLSVSAPVAPKRRSREFRSMSEDSTDGEAASPTTTLHFKTQVDIPPSSPQSPQPQVPKRKQKKGSKSDRISSGSMSPDTSGSKSFNVSLNLDGSKPVSHPEFRMYDQDVFRDSLAGPTSPLESETRQNLISENIISLNKSPHTSITSDSFDVGSFQEIKIKTPKGTPQPQLQETDHSDFVLDDLPIEKNPPFERSYSADKSRTLPLHRKNLPSNTDSDSEEKQKQPLFKMSPDSNQKRWKSVELLKNIQVKPDVPPKNTGLNRVKSTSIKLLSKLQPKSKKPKSPLPDKDDEDYGPDPNDKTGHGATREYPNLEKYPVRRKSRRRGTKNKEPSSPTLPHSEKPLAAAAAAAAPVAPLTIPLPLEENDEPVKERVYLRSWDPTPLLKELYEIRLMDDDTEDLSHRFIEMEGLMEKLPMNKKKATLLKTWKRRYFRAKNGWLIYYDNRHDEKPSDEVLLMGGQVHAIGSQVIGIDDGRGRYLMVRCPSPKEYEQWLTALQSQTTDNTRATYVRPSINALQHPSKKVVLIEFGSMSIRAGILKEHATLPQLFFPNVVAISKENNVMKHVIGFDAYKPEVRHSSQLVQPFGPTDKVDKFKVDFETLPSVFTAIFQDLKIATAEYYVMLILPLNIRDEEKSILMNILINQFQVCGVCMASQALLALYSYNAQSGIIVDIGERLEVLPIYEGFVIDGGHTVQSFGAPKIRQSLRSGLTSENYPLYSPLEQLLVRLVMEQTCYVSKNFKEDCQQYQETPEKYQETLYLRKYDLPEETYTAISHSLSRFVSPEGLFNTDLWGMDYPTVQSLVKNAIEACPMDNRRHLCRSIYLSGGVTLLPGFASRLEAELHKHLNETLVIQVHASPQRYHAAYIGACALCSLPEFERSCITSEEWKEEDVKAFKKWKMSS